MSVRQVSVTLCLQTWDLFSFLCLRIHVFNSIVILSRNKLTVYVRGGPLEFNTRVLMQDTGLKHVQALGDMHLAEGAYQIRILEPSSIKYL